jgi:hypothetical protein
MAILLAIVVSSVAIASTPDQNHYFKIQVIDELTGRGVPLVELRTVNNIRFYTDSAGVVAFYEPGLMNSRVYFSVTSHGYEYAKDGFGYPGARLQVKAGGSTVLKIRRVNIAERLYRMTGAGIYRDTVLVGAQAPIRQPLLNGKVFGSDSVVNTEYRGKIYWFWGDTNRPSYPLGNFHVPGATSVLPADGGLDPEIGVNLTYFIGKEGFAKPTAQMPGKGPTWINGLVTVKDRDGRETLFANYVKIKPPMTVYERGLIEFDDQRQQFGQRKPIPLDAPLYPVGHPMKHVDQGVQYVYFGHPFPRVRVRATAEDMRDLSKYESYTCLVHGSRDDSPELDRDDDGHLRFAWKRGTPAVVGKLRKKLIQQKELREDEELIALQDVQTGKSIAAHGGSVYWNEYRQRWVAIILESFGSSLLGEIWYAESDAPLGPWVYARKVVTHEKYSFYNPKQHPMFDKDGGRTIFFEGTYTNMFSGNPDQTPRYNYNQIMYKLDLTDARLVLPVPVYEHADADDARRFVTGEHLDWEDRRGLVAGPPTGDDMVLFHALPGDLADPAKTAVPLYEYVCEGHPNRLYSTRAKIDAAGYQRREQPLCLVWPNPVKAILP